MDQDNDKPVEEVSKTAEVVSEELAKDTKTTEVVSEEPAEDANVSLNPNEDIWQTILKEKAIRDKIKKEKDKQAASFFFSFSNLFFSFN